MRTYLANIDWNNLLTNKTAQNFKDEIEGITERIVPLRIQGKGPRRNTCQKKLLRIRKSAHKQMLWGYINTL